MRIQFLGVSAPTAKPPIRGAFPLTITPRDRWGTMVQRLALHQRDRRDWPELVKQLLALHQPDYAIWPTIDMVGQPLGVAWFALVEPSLVGVDEAGRWLPEPPAVVYLDPEFVGVSAAA